MTILFVIVIILFIDIVKTLNTMHRKGKKKYLVGAKTKATMHLQNMTSG